MSRLGDFSPASRTKAFRATLEKYMSTETSYHVEVTQFLKPIDTVFPAKSYTPNHVHIYISTWWGVKLYHTTTLDADVEELAATVAVIWRMETRGLTPGKLHRRQA